MTNQQYHNSNKLMIACLCFCFFGGIVGVAMNLQGERGTGYYMGNASSSHERVVYGYPLVFYANSEIRQRVTIDMFADTYEWQKSILPGFTVQWWNSEITRHGETVFACDLFFVICVFGLEVSFWCYSYLFKQ